MEIIEPSPTNLDPNKMPKTVESNVFTCAKNQAYSSRVRISKLLVQCNSKVKDLEELEDERGEEESEDEEADEIRKDLLEDMSKIKLQLEAHREFSHQLGLMANYILDCRPGVAIETDKLKRDAREAFNKSLKDEEDLEEKMSTWKKSNRKWLRPKEKVETVKVDNSGGSRSRWIENLARDLRPSVNLKDDGDLKSMKLFKQSMQTYTGYLRKDVDMTPDLYYDIFMNLCEPDMRKKLDSVKGIREMGETKIWEIIEGILVETNPMYIRRVKANDLQMEKGEMVGDFFNRLRNGYAEVEMEKATPWTLFNCKLKSCIPSSGNDSRVKEQLL